MRHTNRILTLTTIAALALTGDCAHGQVIINMPPPKKPPAAQQSPAPAPPSQAEQVQAAQAQPDVGVLALSRYAMARTGAYDTYQLGGRSARSRSYNDSLLWWGFPHFGFGFVGHHHHHHHHSCSPKDDRINLVIR